MGKYTGGAYRYSIYIYYCESFILIIQVQLHVQQRVHFILKIQSSLLSETTKINLTRVIKKGK